MYLSDRDIEALLAELHFDTEDPDNPFNPLEQIQPCSVDLRLDGTMWEQMRDGAIDLRRIEFQEFQPHRHWRRIRLLPNESITLKPGQMLLGRTFECFSIPPGHAGKLEGRSSFARLGLSIHCSADFINPGYRGRMPLQLVNHGKSPIVLFPHIPVCQLMLVRLSSPSRRVYGDPDLGSKYFPDDGGPSYWWRDRVIRRLRTSMGQRAVSDEIQRRLVDLIGPREKELIDRFENTVRRLPAGELTNPDEILGHFAKAEDRSRRIAHLKRNVLLWVGPTFLVLSLGSLFSPPIGWLHYGFWLLTALALLVGGHEFWWGVAPGDYLGEKELAQLRQDRGGG